MRGSKKSGFTGITGQEGSAVPTAGYFANSGKVTKTPLGAATHDSIVLSAPPPDPRLRGKRLNVGAQQTSRRRQKPCWRSCLRPLPLCMGQIGLVPLNCDVRLLRTSPRLVRKAPDRTEILPTEARQFRTKRICYFTNMSGSGREKDAHSCLLPAPNRLWKSRLSRRPRVRASRPGDFWVLFIPEKYLARGRNIPYAPSTSVRTNTSDRRSLHDIPERGQLC